MPKFDHEGLDVYQVSISFVSLADDIVEHLPRGRAYLADQLQRAALSIPLNIAEGAGEFSPKDKKRFWCIGEPPSDDKEHEVIVTAFRFVEAAAKREDGNAR